MTFPQAVLSVYRNYATFSGRAPRSEYWWFYLFFMLASAALSTLDAAIGTNGLLTGLFLIASLLPVIAVAVRRLHDVDRSGWWYFIVLVPLVGVIVQFVWACTRGTTGTNRFGADPLGN